jgi:hypothetical protein
MKRCSVTRGAKAIKMGFATAVSTMLLAGCAVGSQSYRPQLSPVAYRLTKTATGAAATLGLERLGVKQPWAAIAGILGPVAIGKAIRTRDEHPLGDWACDMVWSAPVAVVVIAKPKSKWHLSLGALTAGAWAAAAVATDQACIP